MFPEPFDSRLIGLLELILAGLFFHRALPAMIGIHADAQKDGERIGAVIDRLARSRLGFAASAIGILRAIAREAGQRIMILKMWALAVALGSFGIGRFFGPVYAEPNAWIYTGGHYCLIAYSTLRLIHISRLGPRKWWRQP